VAGKAAKRTRGQETYIGCVWLVGGISIDPVSHEILRGYLRSEQVFMDPAGDGLL
jgi:hypothetical protein